MATTKKNSKSATKSPRSSAEVTGTPKAPVRKKRAPGKATSKLPASFTLEPKASAQEPAIAHDDIALRAYFIGERRQQMGWPGDSATDWADAEAQLRAEALEKPLKKR